jgi:hypothetical protein
MVKDVQISVTDFNLPGTFGAASTMILDAELMKAGKFAKTEMAVVTVE